MPLSQLTQSLLKAEGGNTTIEDLQKNANAKQYNVVVKVDITETNNNKAFFTGGIDYTGVPYGFVIAVEAMLTEALGELVKLGAEIATGGEATPPTP